MLPAVELAVLHLVPVRQAIAAAPQVDSHRAEQDEGRVSSDLVACLVRELSARGRVMGLMEVHTLAGVLEDVLGKFQVALVCGLLREK